MVGTVPGADYFECFYGDRDWRLYRPILSKAIEHSEPGPMLDVGAGTGLLVEAALRFGLDCEGIEGSEAAVAAARERYREIRLRQHLLGNPFPFGDASFRTVFLNHVIEHLEPSVAELALAEIHRVLQPDGMLYVGSPSRFNRRARRNDPTHVQLYTPKELARLLGRAGFVRIAPLDHPLPLLGRSRLGLGLATALFRLTSWHRLSASANVIAYKPDRGSVR